jgi:glyoxylase-like metal-dependent hydrolase (beta-lactamase superfamily II)
MTLTLSRRALFGTAAGAGAAAMLPLRAAFAEAPAAARVVTYSRRIGEIEVITLLDGYFLLEQAWVTALDPALIVEGLASSALDSSAPVPLPITGYLIRQGDSLTLIDAGAGGSLGPTAGNLAATLVGVGIAPEAVTRLVFSHLHPDHIGGALSGDAPTFTNATVHVSSIERAFWSDPANASAVPDAMKPWFDLAGQVLAAYGDRLETFDGDADLGGGVTAVAMPGHTPGHSGFRVSSGPAQALLWGDSTAIASLQFAHPDAGIVFDTDGVQGAITRRRVLDMAVADKMLVSGTHMPFPGFGHVDQKGEAYAWVPEEWKLF